MSLYEITNNKTGEVTRVGADALPVLFPTQDIEQISDMLLQGATLFPEQGLPVLRAPKLFGNLFSRIFRS